MAFSYTKNRKLMFTVIFIGAAFIGAVYGGMQFIIYKIALEYHLNNVKMGSIVSVFFAAIAVAAFLAGPVSDRIGKKKVMLCMIIMTIAGSSICAAAASITCLMIGIIVLGGGVGGLEGVTTAALSDLAGEKSGRYINYMQGVLSAGSFCIPVVLQTLMDLSDIGWRAAFIIFLAGFIVMLFIGMFVKDTKPIRKHDADGCTAERIHGAYTQLIDRAGPRKSDINILDRYAMALALCVGIYVFIEDGISYFMDVFMTVEIGEEDLSAFALSLFWLTMALSRMLCGLLYRHEDVIIKTSFICAGILMFSMSFVRSIPGILVITGLMGTIFAPLWPFLMGKLNKHFPNNTGFATGLGMLTGGVLSMFSPVALGLIFDIKGISAGYIFLAAVAACGVICFVAGNMQSRPQRYKE